VTAIALLLLTFVSSTPVDAQDREAIVGYRIVDESIAGPFTVELQVSPAAPIVGISRFAVRVRDSATGEDIDDAMVSLLGSPAEHGEAQYTLALNSPADPTYYLSQLKLETVGVWAIDVRVESELGEGTSIMSVLVAERGRSGTGNGWGQVLFGLVIAAFAGGISWVWYSSRKALRSRDAQNR
jgi:hypothetical protein